MKRPNKISRGGWNRKERLLLVERLEMYVSSGLPIDKALAAAGYGMPEKRVRTLIQAQLSVEGGYPLAAALQREIRLPSAIAGLISCGESSGNLASTLKAGCLLMERESELLKKCLSAMIYPAVIGVAAAVLTIGLVRGVMPQIIPLLVSLHSRLPLLTRIVIRVSDIFTAYGVYLAVATSLAVVLSVVLYRRSEAFRSAIHHMMIRTPLIGSLGRRYGLSIFFSSLGALVGSGMPIQTAYAQTVSSISLLPLRKICRDLEPRVSRGEPLHSLFSAAVSSRMLPYIAPLLAAGEASGNLAEALSRAARILDRELDNDLKQITSLIEPVMMLAMGGAVGSIALAIMMPIYDISKALQH